VQTCALPISAAGYNLAIQHGLRPRMVNCVIAVKLIQRGRTRSLAAPYPEGVICVWLVVQHQARCNTATDLVIVLKQATGIDQPCGRNPPLNITEQALLGLLVALVGVEQGPGRGRLLAPSHTPDRTQAFVPSAGIAELHMLAL